MNELQKIYNSEINISIISFWDAGYTLKLGGPINFDAEGIVEKTTEIIPWFQKSILEHYPDSEYAKSLPQ